MTPKHIYSPLDAQTRALMEMLKQSGFKPAHQIPLELSRAGLTQMAVAMGSPKVDVHSSEDRSIPGPGGPLPIRIYRPGPKTAKQPAVVFFHGGGFYLGNLETHDHVCRFLCKNAKLIVIAVDYRLAPENKFPAAVDDGYFSLCWVAENAGELGVDPERIALVGDSAGGSLVVSTCLMARQRGGPAIAYQVVVYPALTLTDGTEFPSRVELGSGEYFIAKEDFEFFRNLYLRNPADEVLDPLASPIMAKDYRGLPPALIVAAEYDPCRSENEVYAERLEQDGVAVTYKCFAGTIHPFFLFDGPLDVGKEGQKFVADELRKHLGA